MYNKDQCIVLSIEPEVIALSIMQTLFMQSLTPYTSSPTRGSEAADCMSSQ